MLTYNRGPGVTEIPSVGGLTEEEAKTRLEKRGFSIQTEFQFNDRIPEDRVIGTEPAVGTTVESGSTVKLLVSRGSNRVEVPDVTGLNDQQALDALEAVELGGNVVQRDDEAPAGEVVGQSPGAGRMVARGTQVTIFVSTGVVVVPDVRGQQRKAAVTALKQEGFIVSVSEEPTTDVDESNRVINQFPPGGSRGQRGDTVTITVGVLEAPPPPAP